MAMAPSQVFLKKSTSRLNSLADRGGGEEEEEDTVLPENRLQNAADISEFLEEEVSRQKIELLSNKNMAEAIHEFVDKMENDSVAT